MVCKRVITQVGFEASTTLTILIYFILLYRYTVFSRNEDCVICVYWEGVIVIKTVRRDEESLDSLIRRFHRGSEEIVADYKKHTVYVPKSLRKKMKHEEHLKQLRILERKRQRYGEKKTDE